jgi:hypothetical protein
MAGPLLSSAELYRPGALEDRDSTDRWLAQDALGVLSAHALHEARIATVDGQDWPDWVGIVLAYQCERRDRLATRRELREMAQ